MDTYKEKGNGKKKIPTNQQKAVFDKIVKITRGKNLQEPHKLDGVDHFVMKKKKNSTVYSSLIRWKEEAVSSQFFILREGSISGRLLDNCDFTPLGLHRVDYLCFLFLDFH